MSRQNVIKCSSQFCNLLFILGYYISKRHNEKRAPVCIKKFSNQMSDIYSMFQYTCITTLQCLNFDFSFLHKRHANIIFAGWLFSLTLKLCTTCNFICKEQRNNYCAYHFWKFVDDIRFIFVVTRLGLQSNNQCVVKQLWVD